MTKKTYRGRITIDRERCKGCYLCVAVCPQGRIAASCALNQKGYYPAEVVENPSESRPCITCARCAAMCPDGAIEVYRGSE